MFLATAGVIEAFEFLLHVNTTAVTDLAAQKFLCRFLLQRKNKIHVVKLKTTNFQFVASLSSYTCSRESKAIFECSLCGFCRAPGERQGGQQRRRTPAERCSESSAARNPETKQELRPSSAAEVSVDFITQTIRTISLFLCRKTNKQKKVDLFLIVLLKNCS